MSDALLEEQLTAIVREGAALWNGNEFFAAHDKWEEAWTRLKKEKKSQPPADSRRDFVHGLILYAAAYVHWQRGNPTGVTRKLQHARELLAKAPSSAFRIDLSRARRAIEMDLLNGAAGRPFSAAHPFHWDVGPSGI